MAKTIMSVDVNKSPRKQELPLHNRWHPDIPATVTVEPGEVVRVECLDWTGGQIANNDSADDIHTVDLDQVHYLSGPIAVKGAEPGDLLVVDILDVGPLQSSPWGFTGIFAKTNGGGFLTDQYPDACKAIWDFEGIYATSRHIPGVRFAGIIHPGLIGTAPSQELLDEWNAREKKLVDTDPDRVPPLALLPTEHSAYAGALTGSDAERVAREGARTVPGRENGGNCDIKNLTRGSRAYFPVYVAGANLSIGDLHFSQGDGEISFCGGIEMAGYVDIKVDIIKQGCDTYNVKNPLFETSPLEPNYTKYLVFEGISVDEDGEQKYLDAHVAYKQACLQAIDHLKGYGYTGEQAYMLLSTAPVEGRLSGIVDIPNAVCTVAIPADIFDFDILPQNKKPVVVDRDDIARSSKKGS
jgi:formamidase